MGVECETAKLKEAELIKEVDYMTCLSNVVLVKNSNGKWKICVDYTNLNKTCAKDSYSLPSIDWLVNGASDFHVFNFLNTYSRYNQIRRYPPNEEKTTFMIEGPNYCYQGSRTSDYGQSLLRLDRQKPRGVCG
ncbi:hypothetical protein CR513_51140, partial [Mucuna pruriens]